MKEGGDIRNPVRNPFRNRNHVLHSAIKSAWRHQKKKKIFIEKKTKQRIPTTIISISNVK